MSNKVTIEQIEDVLPQTQCRECGYDGCNPYARAIVLKNEAIDRCPPGGTETLIDLATLLKVDPKPFLKEMAEKAKPPKVAIIREDECIGCTKCITACPTDAIIGAGKMMHTVIADACTGCELCINPCPVDCIDMVETPPKKQKIPEWKKRFEEKNKRIERSTQEKIQKHQRAKQHVSQHLSMSARKAAIASAVNRAKAKKRVTQHE